MCKLSGLMKPLGLNDFFNKRPWETAGATAREIANSGFGYVVLQEGTKLPTNCLR